MSPPSAKRQFPSRGSRDRMQSPAVYGRSAGLCLPSAAEGTYSGNFCSHMYDAHNVN